VSPPASVPGRLKGQANYGSPAIFLGARADLG
jgi:hypothetical protein